MYKINTVVGFDYRIIPLCYSAQFITHALIQKVFLFPIDQCIHCLAFFCFVIDVVGMIMEDIVSTIYLVARCMYVWGTETGDAVVERLS